MSLYKSAQEITMDNITDLGDKDEVILYEDKPEPEDVIELHQPEEEAVVSFKLPSLPGCPDKEALEVSTEDTDDKNDLEMALTEKSNEKLDPWDWPKTHGTERILDWAKHMFDNIPKHTGKETTGIERVISYLKRMNNEISKCISNDFDGKVDIGKLEEVRKEIYSAIPRLEEANDQITNQNYKKKKSGLDQDSLIKNGSMRAGGVVVTVPLLISNIASICINSTVSSGKDIEKTAIHMSKKYKLDDREWMELVSLITIMGYPTRLDRGRIGEVIDTTSVDNYDWMPNYNA